MVQCKKQPIVQLEPLDLVSTVQLNTNIKYSFLVRLGNRLALVVTKRRHHKGWPYTGLHPFLTSDMDQHEFTILKLNAKIQFSSGHKFLNTGITVVRFALGIGVSATAYLA